MKIYKLGYCGLFCGACEMFLSTKNIRLSVLSKKEDIPETLLMCEGCKSKITSIYCRNCSIKKCCMQKGISICAECDEFPCSVLKAFENDYCLHHKGLIRSHESIMEIGIETYIREQEDRWKCSKCNKQHSWYDKICTHCGNQVNGLGE